MHNDDTITTSGHSSLEKYTSHFIRKGCVWEVSWRLNRTGTYLPPNSSSYKSIFFHALLGCSTGGLEAKPLLGHGSHFSTFSPTDPNILSPGLYNNLTSTYFLWASHFTLNSTRRQSRVSPDIFDRMHLLFIQVHFLFWQPGRVRGQYVTLAEFWNIHFKMLCCETFIASDISLYLFYF